jgi:hypothetical protein
MESPTVEQIFEPLKAISIYHIARYIQYLKERDVDDPVVYDNGSIEKNRVGYILFVMQQLRDLLNQHGLAQGEIHELNRLIDMFEDKYTKVYASKKINYEDLMKMLRCIERIEALVKSELRGRSFLEISFSGILNYRELLSKGISMLFSDEKILDSVSTIIKYDLEEAIKALAYDVSTASAMISLRAVEGALRELYAALSGESEVKEGWKQVLDKVTSLIEQKNLGTKELMGYLDYIRVVRNKAEHPDKIFTKKEAELILIQCVRAIEEIYEQLKLMKNA